MSINNRNHDVNRGVELLLKRRRKNLEEPKLKGKLFSFGKVFSLFRREIKINFEILVKKK